MELLFLELFFGELFFGLVFWKVWFGQWIEYCTDVSVSLVETGEWDTYLSLPISPASWLGFLFEENIR